MVKLMVKEASDEVIYLRKLLQKHKSDIAKDNLSKEENLKAIENFVRITNIIYAKLEFVKKI
jgi:asparagine synthetase B (glutamine-hydrolysing)